MTAGERQLKSTKNAAQIYSDIKNSKLTADFQSNVKPEVACSGNVFSSSEI